MQEFISSEVSRQVDLRVQEEMRAYRATQRAAEHDFLNRPLKEQRMALFLTRFGQEHADAQYGVDKENLDTLARAILVSTFLSFLFICLLVHQMIALYPLHLHVCNPAFVVAPEP
jgi:hypothetical protein